VRWLELMVQADVEAIEPISEIFGRLGRGAVVRPTRLRGDPVAAEELREDPDAPYLISVQIPDDAGARAAIDRTERALWHLQAFGLRPIGDLGVRGVEEADWTEAWKAGYTAQRIGRLVIVPSWLDEPISRGEVAIRIDPGMAFGTGLHPTTRACLAVLEAHEPMARRVLDVGSGSGILAIAALALGAEHARCYDSDPVAVATTRANAEGNGLAEQVDAVLGTLPEAPEHRFELVLANLVASALVELAARLAAHLAPGGMLVASGILAEREAEVITAIERAELEVRDRLVDDDWVTLVAGHRVA